MFEDPWPDKPSRIKTTALFLVPLLLVGAVVYRNLTTATPVTETEAVEMFRAGKIGAGDHSVATGARGYGGDGARTRTDRPVRHRKAGGAGPDERGRAAPAEHPARGRSSGVHSEATAPDRRSDAAWHPGMPKEGVYSWDTEGYESFNGARRRFPEETHRIVTHRRRDTWMNHHVFSKERESWWRSRATRDGYFTLYARNRIVFGPVTRDTEIAFDPPMLTNPMTKVGSKWNGRWDGKTYGTYAGRILDERSMEIDGERVEVVELEFEMEMHGEVEGTSAMRFWVSGEHHMVVREHYKQDVKSGAADYHAEWDMTIESLRPKR
jgi:hypothetical protein